MGETYSNCNELIIAVRDGVRTGELDGEYTYNLGGYGRGRLVNDDRKLARQNSLMVGPAIKGWAGGCCAC